MYLIKKRELRKWITALSALIFLFLYLLLPANQKWLSDRIFIYMSNIGVQLNHHDLNYRKKLRFGEPYLFAKKIEAAVTRVKGINSKDIRVLIPGAAYLKKQGEPVSLPDPVTLYYFTEIKTAFAQYPDANKANCYLSFSKDSLEIRPFKNDTEKSDSIRSFNRQ